MVMRVIVPCSARRFRQQLRPSLDRLWQQSLTENPLISIKHQFAAVIFAAAAFATSTAANAINPGDEVVVGVGTYDDSCESWIAARVAPQGRSIPDH